MLFCHCVIVCSCRVCHDQKRRQLWVVPEAIKGTQSRLPYTTYKLGYVKRGSTAFKVPKDGCGVPSAARALLGPEGLLMR